MESVPSEPEKLSTGSICDLVKVDIDSDVTLQTL